MADAGIRRINQLTKEILEQALRLYACQYTLGQRLMESFSFTAEGEMETLPSEAFATLVAADTDKVIDSVLTSLGELRTTVASQASTRVLGLLNDFFEAAGKSALSGKLASGVAEPVEATAKWTLLGVFGLQDRGLQVRQTISAINNLRGALSLPDYRPKCLEVMSGADSIDHLANRLRA